MKLLWTDCTHIPMEICLSEVSDSDSDTDSEPASESDSEEDEPEKASETSIFSDSVSSFVHYYSTRRSLHLKDKC